MGNNIHIGLAGNIGAGKSTLAEFLGSESTKSKLLSINNPNLSEKKVTVFKERVVNNPYLQFYYKDQNRWAFESQIRFLALRYELQKELEQLKGIVIEDRMFREDEIFAKIALLNRGIHDGVNIGELGFETYKIILDHFLSKFSNPTLVIYLKTDPSVCFGRIKKRGNDYEQAIPLAYLEALNLEYDKFFDNYDGEFIVIDANQDSDQNQNFLTEVVDQIVERLNI